MSQSWSKDLVVSQIKELHRAGEKINSSHIQQTNGRLFGAAQKHCGGWRQAVESAGIDYKSICARRGRKPGSRKRKGTAGPRNANETGLSQQSDVFTGVRKRRIGGAPQNKWTDPRGIEKMYFDDIRPFKENLPHEEIVELARRYREERDPKARETLVLHHLHLVANLAWRFTWTGVPILDLIQEGTLGLLRAIEKFDEQRGFRLTTYATWWIRQAISRAIVDTSNIIRLPAHVEESLGRLRKVGETLTVKLGREPTLKEIAKATSWSVAEVKKLMRAARISTVSIYSETTSSNSNNPGNEEGTLEQVLARKTEALEPSALAMAREELGEKCAEIARLINALLNLPIPARTAEIFCARYGVTDGTFEVKSLEEVGQQFGVTRERIRQILKKAWHLIRELGHTGDGGWMTQQLLDINTLEELTGDLRASQRLFQGAFETGASLELPRPTIVTSEGEETEASAPTAEVPSGSKPEEVINVVSAAYDISQEELRGPSRRAEIAWARQVTMYLLRTEHELSFPEIVHYVGRRDHTTALHAYRTVQKAIEEDESEREFIELMQEILRLPA